ncbi:hypothetical protein IEO21_02699 [Rhodonia placenta]|uniref:Terpene synthase n=1 Tax=Rhodonia placenta TaxID=104341 RepID=A0A8H7U4Q4_9APHY|nr:hypothetical protein IEO21_02699 [Postia placenta]
MLNTPQQYVLPDLLPLIPFKGSFNPHYLEAATASAAWAESYKVVPERKRTAFLQSGSELLCAHAYPYASLEQLRTCCDFVHILFAVDEISDEQTGKDAYATGRVFLDALRYAEWNDGSAISKMTKEFRERIMKVDIPACHNRLFKHCESYVNAFSVEAELRERDEILDIDSYIRLRRENSAVRCCFGLFGYVLGIDLPDSIFEHPVFMRMHLAAVDMVCWSNDLYSYKMEQLSGLTGNNVLTVLMEQNHWTLQQASDHVGVHFKTLLDSFLSDKAQLPSWGPELDHAVSQFVMAMESWAVGNCEWSFATLRYFGPEREEVKKTRVVRLRPKLLEDIA